MRVLQQPLQFSLGIDVMRWLEIEIMLPKEVLNSGCRYGVHTCVTYISSNCCGLVIREHDKDVRFLNIWMKNTFGQRLHLFSRLKRT